MRLLFHIPRSPFARRTRLALAARQLPVELRDVRATPAYWEEARRLSPLKTIPVLVEEDGRVLGDSTAICHYLDRAYPSASPLWPTEPAEALAAFEVASLVDLAMHTAVDLGVRYHALRTSEAWEPTRAEAMERVQRALDALGQRAAALPRPTFCAHGWSAPDMWLYCAEEWFTSLPLRASVFPPAGQILTLGWRLPAEISRWADQHRARPDVRALD